MANLPKPSDSAKGAKLSVLLGTQWGDEGKGELIAREGGDYPAAGRQRI